MSVPLDGRQVFIASPSGLENERAIVRTAIGLYNRVAGIPKGVVFVDRGWEETPPGVGRGQSLINELLDPCDFLIVLLSDKWGSPPGGDDYTSGTEEEFMRAVDLLSRADGTMRDIHVYFRSLPNDRLADPGPELSKVIEFKKKLQDSKQILFGTFDSLETLKAKIEGSLRKWSEPLGTKEPLQLALAPPPQDAVNMQDDLLGAAIEAASAGRTVQAEILFAKASQTGDLGALLEAARFSRRRGLLDDAIDLNTQVVESLSPLVRRTGDESAQLISALANIGVIYRKKGDLSRSIRSLEEAIEVGSTAPQPIFDELAYAYDNLGHSLGQVGRYREAREAFDHAISERRASGDDQVPLSSRLNLGWTSLRAGDSAEALTIFENAEVEARAAEPVELANCLTGRGNALLRLGRAEEAVPHLSQALEINRKVENSDGIGISSGLLARAFAALNDFPAAESAIEDTLRESETSGNVVGLATAMWGRALTGRAQGDLRRSRADLDEALRLARSTGNVSLGKAIERSWSDVDDG